MDRDKDERHRGGGDGDGIQDFTGALGVRDQGGRISRGMASGNDDGAVVGLVQLYQVYLNKSNQGRLWQRTREQDVCRYARNGKGDDGHLRGYENCH